MGMGAITGGVTGGMDRAIESSIAGGMMPLAVHRWLEAARGGKIKAALDAARATAATGQFVNPSQFTTTPAAREMLRMMAYGNLASNPNQYQGQ
jgi:hypothetical protein